MHVLSEYDKPDGWTNVVSDIRVQQAGGFTWSITKPELAETNYSSLPTKTRTFVNTMYNYSKLAPAIPELQAIALLEANMTD